MTNLEKVLANTIGAFQRAGGATRQICCIQASTPWDLHLSITLADEVMIIRHVRQGDEELLHRFRDELSQRSRELFCPYPWDQSNKLASALSSAVQNAVQRRDFSCLMLVNDRPIGHFFLWQAGQHHHANNDGLHVPELGVAISDAYQQRGLGCLAVHIMQAVARDLRHDAIELTTALNNKGGWQTYLKAGFTSVGMIRNPLGVDVTAVAHGSATTETYRTERQMVYIICEAKRQAILAYLEKKRNAFQSI